MKRILEVQKEIGVLGKDSSNPFYKSAYLDLNKLLIHVTPLLHNNGLLLLQPIQDGKVWTQIIDAKDGTVLADSSIDLPTIQDPQKLGSAITYFRRYTLKSLLAIAEGDDDANLASEPEPVKKKRPTVKQLDSAKAKYQNDKTVIDKMIEAFDIDETQIEYIKDETD